MAREEIINLPPASHLCETEFVQENFESTVFFLFLHDLNYFANIQFWIQLSIADPRKLPLTKEALIRYSTHELEIVYHYGQAQSNTFYGNFVQQEPHANPTRAKAEWDDFKILMVLKCNDYEHHVDIEIKAVKNPTNEEGKKNCYAL